MNETKPILATGLGSHPGTDAAAYTEALRIVFGELADEGLPYLPDLPERGAPATPVGRGMAVLTELAADLQPAGWRLTGATTPGLDQRRARSLLAQDLDALEERAQGYAGPLKVQVPGPWTLAATVERPRGDKLVADHGARRELAQALAVGVTEFLDQVRRRAPGATRLVCQVDEPALADVVLARVPTASGYGRHRAVGVPEAHAALTEVVAAVTGVGAEPWLWAGAADLPFAAVPGGIALVLDPAALTADGLDQVAGRLEAGDPLVLTVAPLPGAAVSRARQPREVAERVLRWLEMVGFGLEDVAGRLTLTPVSGLAGAVSPAEVAPMLGLLTAAAGGLAE